MFIITYDTKIYRKLRKLYEHYTEAKISLIMNDSKCENGFFERIRFNDWLTDNFYYFTFSQITAISVYNFFEGLKANAWTGVIFDLTKNESNLIYLKSLIKVCLDNKIEVYFKTNDFTIPDIEGVHYINDQLDI